MSMVKEYIVMFLLKYTHIGSLIRISLLYRQSLVSFSDENIAFFADIGKFQA
jgi:hypothetical protein